MVKFESPSSRDCRSKFLLRFKQALTASFDIDDLLRRVDAQNDVVFLPHEHLVLDPHAEVVERGGEARVCRYAQAWLDGLRCTRELVESFAGGRVNAQSPFRFGSCDERKSQREPKEHSGKGRTSRAAQK